MKTRIIIVLFNAMMFMLRALFEHKKHYNLNCNAITWGLCWLAKKNYYVGNEMKSMSEHNLFYLAW